MTSESAQLWDHDPYRMSVESEERRKVEYLLLLQILPT